ncbi:MAG: 16S rRNA (uracil(1498)-N(3))-methyltransferase [Arcanobacterium sp.]|nr:16S rRNA (uracil(1498)-N(3))-methyltransferase [Arcanobacterium sp.]
MTLPVFFDPQLNASVGEQLRLTGDEGRHAVAVRRIRVGEQIDIIDGVGQRATVSVAALGKNELSAEVLAVVHEPAPKVPTLLVQALAKGGRDEQAVETATEFGVTKICPWESQRAVVSWKQPQKAEKGIAKWQAVALAGAKQARRSWVPEVQACLDSKGLTRKITELIAAGWQVYVCHEQEAQHFTKYLQAQRDAWSAGEFPAGVAFIVGPEGGITDDEVQSFVSAGAQAVLLGEHVMRSATAGPWAIAVLSAAVREFLKTA